MHRYLAAALFAATSLTPLVLHAQTIATSPPVNFVNSTTSSIGTTLFGVLSDYATLLKDNPSVMTQNIQTVVTLTNNRTPQQTLMAIHDDRTDQQYSVSNGLGVLTSLFMTGTGASTTGTAPTSLTKTTYAGFSLANYQANINFLTNASWGTTKFGNGTATPLAAAVNFINNTVRANSSTEPTKRIFSHFTGSYNPSVELNPAFQNYNASTTAGRAALSTALTSNLYVPSYFGNFAVPAVYGNITNWVQGFTVTQAMINANGGNPITVPNLGTYDANGNFSPFLFKAGDYVAGIGDSPRPWRLDSQVAVPTLLFQIANNTNPYADGAFPSGHTNSAFTQAIGLSFLVPQEMQSLLTRASELGFDRILAGMHSPLDVMGGRTLATAIAATNIYNALYDANGNRVDWTNPANASAYAVYQAFTQTQAYLSSACGTTTVAACIAAGGDGSSAAYGTSAQNKANYLARLTMGFTPTGPNTPMTVAQVPVQAAVLLLTRFPYLTDQQRLAVLASTAIGSGFPVLDGDTFGGWGRLNLVAAADGFGSFTDNVAITMDASQGGYSAIDSWNNDISGSGGLTLNGTGELVLTGNNTYTGPTVVNGGTLAINGTDVSPITVNLGGTLRGTGTIDGATTVAGRLAPGNSPGTLTFNAPVTLAPTATAEFDIDGPGIGTGAGNYSRVIVNGSGNTFAANGILQPLLRGISGNASNSFTPVIGEQFNVITAAGGLTGSFSGLLQPAGLASNTRIDALYEGNNLNLVVTPASYTTLLGSGGNQANALAVAGAIDSTRPVAGIRLGASASALYTPLYALAAPAIAPALAQLAPASYGDALLALRDGWYQAQDSADQALAARRGAATPANAVKTAQGLTLWTSGLGQFSNTGSTGGNPGYTASLGGVSLGADGDIRPDWTLGTTFTYGSTTMTASDNARFTGDSYRLGLYSEWRSGRAFIDGQAGIGYNEGDLRRSSSLLGLTSRGNLDGLVSGGSAKAGMDVLWGLTTIEPSVALQGMHIDRNATTESGASGAGESITASGLASMETVAAVTAQRRLVLSTRYALVPSVTVGWSHEFLDTRGLTTASLAASPAAFTVSSAAIGRDAALAGIRVELDTGTRVHVYAGYNGAFSSGATVNAVNAGLRMTW